MSDILRMIWESGFTYITGCNTNDVEALGSKVSGPCLCGLAKVEGALLCRKETEAYRWAMVR